MQNDKKRHVYSHTSIRLVLRGFSPFHLLSSSLLLMHTVETHSYTPSHSSPVPSSQSGSSAMFTVHIVASAPVHDARLSKKQPNAQYLTSRFFPRLFSPVLPWTELISTLLLSSCVAAAFWRARCAVAAWLLFLTTQKVHLRGALSVAISDCVCFKFMWAVCVLECVCVLCVSACLKLAENQFLKKKTSLSLGSLTISPMCSLDIKQLH